MHVGSAPGAGRPDVDASSGPDGPDQAGATAQVLECDRRRCRRRSSPTGRRMRVPGVTQDRRRRARASCRASTRAPVCSEWLIVTRLEPHGRIASLPPSTGDRLAELVDPRDRRRRERLLLARHDRARADHEVARSANSRTDDATADRNRRSARAVRDRGFRAASIGDQAVEPHHPEPRQHAGDGRGGQVEALQARVAVPGHPDDDDPPGDDDAAPSRTTSRSRPRQAASRTAITANTSDGSDCSSRRARGRS